MSEWVVLAFAILTVLMSGAVAWGVTKTKVDGLLDRIKWFEEQKYVTREEFEARHKEIQERLYRSDK